MTRKNRVARSVALGMACAAMGPAARGSGIIDEYQFTNGTFAPTAADPNLITDNYVYVNANPTEPPFGNPPFVVQGGGTVGDPPWFVAQGDWFPQPMFNDNYYEFDVTVAPGKSFNASSFSYYVNSRQGVLFDGQIAYSTDPTFATAVNFNATPFLIPAADVWNTFTASDAPITNGTGTYYFRVYAQIDPNGTGTISDLLNMSNVTLNGSVQADAGATPMYWDPGSNKTFGSGGSGTWLAGSVWADGKFDYAWSNTIAESANFGGASGGAVALGGNVSVVNGINFTTAGYNITGTAGEVLSVSGTINTAADATISAVMSNSGTGTLIKAGAGALVIPGGGNVTAGPLLSVVGGSINQIGGAVAAGNVQLSGGYTLSGGMLSTGGISGVGGSTFNFNGGTVQMTAANSTVLTGITNLLVQNGGAIIDTNGNTASLGQSLIEAAGSTGGLTKVGSGNLVFGGTGVVNVAYAAGALIDIQAGTLTGSANAQGIWTSNLASMNVASGATFNAEDAGPTGAMQIDALSGGGQFSGGNLGTTTVTIGAAGGSGNFSGTLANNAGATLAIVKTGAGTETFSGTNSYNGSTSVMGGTLKLAGNVAPSATAFVGTGAALEYDTSGRTFQTPIVYTGTGTVRVSGNGNLVFGAFGNVVVDLSAGAVVDVESGQLTGSSSFGGIWTSNQASLNVAGGALFDAVEAGPSQGMQVDALTGNGTFQGGYFGNTGGVSTLTIGVAGGSGSFGGVLQDDASAHLALVKTGAGTQTFSGSNTYTGGTTINRGTLIVGAASALPPGGNVTLVGQDLLQLSPGSGNAHIGSLAISADGTVDVTNNGLTLNYSGLSPLPTLLAEINSGYNGGTWTGKGITSSTAASHAKFAIGYADGNADSGTPAKANQVVLAYTLLGDANLAGSVGIADLLIVAQNFGKTGKDWAHGDFGYGNNGAVGIADLLLVAQNFGHSTPIAGGGVGGGGGVSAAWEEVSAVPEPGMGLGALAAAGMLLGRRGRRKTTPGI